MNYHDNNIAIMNNRTPLPVEKGIQLTEDIRLISCLSECGGSSITYLASTGAGIRVIKEIYPLFSEAELCRNGYRVEVKDHPELNQLYKEKLALKTHTEQSTNEMLCMTKDDGIEGHASNSVFHFSVQNITDKVLAYNHEFEGTIASYLASDTVYGRTLTDILEEKEFALEDAIEYTRKILRPIRRLHERKHMLHLDIKCDNVFFPNELMKDDLYRDETYCILLDCGGAQPIELDCNSWAVSASTGYSAIESQKVKKYSEEVKDERALKKYLCMIGTHTDIYSVAAISFRMIMGKLFDEEKWKVINTSEIQKKRQKLILEEFTRRLNSEYPYLIDRMCEIFNKALYYHSMEKIQDYRYTNCKDIVDDLSILLEIIQNKGMHPEIAAMNSLKQFEQLKCSVKMEINQEWFGEIEEQ